MRSTRTFLVAQGGDWANYVIEQMGLLTPPELLGIHTNMLGAVPDVTLRPGKSRSLSLRSFVPPFDHCVN
jgi:hypothetical protein